MLLSMEELLVGAAVVALGQFVYAMAGFGSGMVSVSLYALLVGDLRFFVPAFLLLCLPTETAITWRTRHLQDWPRTLRVVAWSLPTLALGAWMLGFVHARALALGLGFVIAALGAWYLFFESRVFLRFDRPWHLPAASLAAGLLGGLFAVAGPPIILYFKSLRLDKSAFRAALISIWLCMTCLKIPMYAALGLYSGRSFAFAGAWLAASATGAWAGNALHARIPETVFRRLTSFLVLAAGVLLIVQNISAK